MFGLGVAVGWLVWWLRLINKKEVRHSVPLPVVLRL
eukprot:COSAG01_NODE_22783_length_841_cov_1.115903_1_plen_35_part_10